VSIGLLADTPLITAAYKTPGCDRPVRDRDVQYRKLSLAGARRSKRKTNATAAFLGDSDPISLVINRKTIAVAATQHFLSTSRSRSGNAFAPSKKTGAEAPAFIRVETNKRPSGRGLLAVGLEPRIDQRYLRVDRRKAQPLLLGDELHELVGALDVRRSVLQRAGGGCRARQALRGGGIFLVRYEVAWRSAELHTEIEDEVVDRLRLLGI